MREHALFHPGEENDRVLEAFRRVQRHQSDARFVLVHLVRIGDEAYFGQEVGQGADLAGRPE